MIDTSIGVTQLRNNYARYKKHTKEYRGLDTHTLLVYNVCMAITDRYKITNKEYNQIHYWLKKNFGKANCCEKEDCKGISKKFEWALKKDCGYEKKRDSFQMLCKSCHAIQDVTEEGMQKLSDSYRGKVPKVGTIKCEICDKDVHKAHIRRKYCDDCNKKQYYLKEQLWRKKHPNKIKQYEKNRNRKNIRGVYRKMS